MDDRPDSDLPEDIARAKRHAAEVANGVALLIGAGAYATDLGQTRAFDWIGLLWAFAIGLATWGGTYAVAYAAIRLLPGLFPPPGPDIPTKERPLRDSGQASQQPKRENSNRAEYRTRSATEPIYSQLQNALPGAWFSKVDWRGLAHYVATDDAPEFSRLALLSWVGHFIFSRRDASDTTPTFPEAMMSIGAAEIENNGYEWTGRGVAIMRALSRELNSDPSPTPMAGYRNGDVPVT